MNASTFLPVSVIALLAVAQPPSLCGPECHRPALLETAPLLASSTVNPEEAKPVKIFHYNGQYWLREVTDVRLFPCEQAWS